MTGLVLAFGLGLALILFSGVASRYLWERDQAAHDACMAKVERGEPLYCGSWVVRDEAQDNRLVAAGAGLTGVTLFVAALWVPLRMGG